VIDSVRLRRPALAIFVSAMALTAASPSFGEAAPPGSQGTPPPATPQGCHGVETVLFKQLTGDPAQDPAIVGQAQTELGRGGTLQAFLVAVCGVGSQA
jgi:hypothetical protein